MIEMGDLSSIEQRVLRQIYLLGGKSSLDKLVKKSELDRDTIFSVLERLSRKKAVKISARTYKKARLTVRGMEAVAKGLPERRIYRLIMKHKGKIKIEDLMNKMKGENEENIKSAIGWARRKGWVKIRKGVIIANFKKEPPKEIDEKILEKMSEDERWKTVEGIDRELLETLEILKRRKLIEFNTESKIIIFLTKKGKEMLKKKEEPEITILTRNHLINRVWKKKKIKKYNVTAPPPRIYYGNKHFFSDFINRIKDLLVKLGFKEVYGPLVELEFWNFDILLYPQDNPIRDFEKPLILKQPSIGEITYKEKINDIRNLHKKRGELDGPKYSWSVEYAKRLILRTSTIPALLRYIVSEKEKEDTVKIFCIDRTFRAIKTGYKDSIETIDISILYSQDDANVGNLKELLKILFRELKIRNYYVRPSYQPYTEPTFEILIRHRRLGWIECAKMGVLREEISSNILKINKPTLVWNIDASKLAFSYFNLNDIRELFTRKLEKLQENPFEV